MMHVDTTPWYRQFWPWLLIALPTSAVLACATTIWLVLQHPDAPIERDPTPVSAVLSTNSVVPPKQ